MVEPLDLTDKYIAELKAKIARYEEELKSVKFSNFARKTEIKNSINAIKAVLETDEQEKRRKPR